MGMNQAGRGRTVTRAQAAGIRIPAAPVARPIANWARSSRGRYRMTKAPSQPEVADGETEPRVWRFHLWVEVVAVVVLGLFTLGGRLDAWRAGR